jgi:hypothetical protein
MRIYLDEDSAGTLLTRLLQNAGHDVQRPADVGLVGAHDAVQLTHAIRERRICLSHNYGDFEYLHLLVREAQGHHPGILVVRREKNPKRNLAQRDIVRALAKLEGAAVPLVDEYIHLE